ncbi:MAG: Flp family type IVb pilin [Hyphomonas sp.]|uniref:Flp family type IVb pilin n=1 Tax=Hyphomonas sp. TaxID=87 RepID=UPI003527080B
MRTKSTALLKRLLSDESGATAVEYTLVMALIAIAIIGSITSIGVNINGKMNTIATSIEN